MPKALNSGVRGSAPGPGLLSPPVPIKLNWRQIIQATVRTLGVVLAPPGLHDCLRFDHCQEFLHIQALIPKAGIERFAIGILPWRGWIDVVGVDALPIEPGTQGPGNELGSI